MRVIYPLVGWLIGQFVVHGSDLLFPLVLLIILFGVFFARAILVMSHARWDHLFRLEFDWFMLMLSFTVVLTFDSTSALYDSLTWGAVWLSGAIFMFWITFVARAISNPVREPGHCPECDYDLYGLPERRCPECGRTFTLEEIS